MKTRLHRLMSLMVCVLALSVAVACEPEQPRGAATAPQTSRMGISKDGSTLYIALADHDEVRAVDASSGKVTSTVAVAGYPHRLTVLSDGRVAVVSRYSGVLSVLDMGAHEIVAEVDVGSDPFGVVQTDGSLWVAVGGEGDLARVAMDDLTRVAQRIALSSDKPRGLAVTPEGKLLVSHSTSGTLSIVDVNAREQRGSVDMHLPSRAFFAPTQMDALTVSHDGGEVAVPHVECNNDPAQFGGGGTDLAGSAAQYYVQGPTGFPAVVPAVSRADVNGEVLLSDDNAQVNPDTGVLSTERTGDVSPLLNPLDQQELDGEFVNGPSAVAFANDGAIELVVARGSGNVLVRRSHVSAGQDSTIGVVKVGVGAEAIAVSPDGTRAFVYNAFDDNVIAFEIPDAVHKTSKYDDTSNTDDIADFFGARKEPLVRIEPLAQFTVAKSVLPANILRGREMFHAVDERMTRSGTIACASCHPGGAADSMTWQFEPGPRQSQPLWGGISNSAPYHWDSAVPTFADISTVTIQGRMGGAGLSATQMGEIAAYLDTLPAPAPPRTADGASVQHGAALFASDATGCTTCHTGGDGSDGLLHNVGTGTAFSERESMDLFATPTLHGLAHTGPYLHNGSARTLEDFVSEHVLTDRMGHGSQLSATDAADLVAYLKSL